MDPRRRRPMIALMDDARASERPRVRDAGDLRRELTQPARAPLERRLGEILLEARLIDAAQLERALARQRGDRSRHLGRILVDSGVLEPGQVHAALARKFGFACLSIDGLDIEPGVFARIPEDLAIRHRVLPLAEIDGALVVAMERPFDTTITEDLRFHGIAPVLPVYAPAAEIALAHARFHAGLDEAAEIARTSPPDSARETRAAYDEEAGARRKPIVRLVHALLVQGVLHGASDINIRPARERIIVWYRIDGVMRQVRALHRSLLPALVSRIKILGDMNIAERRLPQEGRARLDHEGRSIDLRISVIPTVAGESVVVRILDRAAGLKPLAKLGLPPAALATLSALITRPHGLFLVTGPTGSGKSTTLYAALNEIRGSGAHVLTVEDPVEYDIEGVEQVLINERIGLGFAEVLRRFLRHDPDVIMVGEIRDPETAAIACQAALTGHFVLSTLHTNDAPGAIARLIDMGVEPCLLASTLLGVVAQRLVRRVCAHCAECDPAVPATADAMPMRGRGCAACGHSGYRGRAMVCEVLEVTPTLSALIGRNAATGEIAREAAVSGMTTLHAHALELARAGITTFEEAASLQTA